MTARFTPDELRAASVNVSSPRLRAMLLQAAELEAAVMDDDRADEAISCAVRAGFDTDDGRWDQASALEAYRAALFSDGQPDAGRGESKS